jgi:hypothetical protein
MSLTKASYSMISGETANILDYGADPTGVASSTAALNAALATGNSVFIPKGIFRLTGETVVPSGARIFGVGPNKSEFKCDVSAHTGVFLRLAGGNNFLEDVGFFGTSTSAGTAIYLSAVNVYEFTGYLYVKNVNVREINLAIRINCTFITLIENCRIYANEKGILVDPQYDGVGDNGYFTTLSINKTIINQNSDYGFKAIPTLVSKNLSFRDSAIESNTGSVSGYQSLIENVDPLQISNCYFEAVDTIPFMRLSSCNTYIYQAYVNGTGGLDLQGATNYVVAQNFYGTAATDKVIATGGAIQRVEFWDSSLGSDTNITAAFRIYKRTSVGATYYRNYVFGLGLTLATNSGNTNTSYQEEVLLYKKTVSATVNANSSALLITNQYLPNTWNADFVIGSAQIANSYQPNLLFQVTPATTGSDQYYCVVAHNLSGSPITLSNALLKIMFVKGAAMAVT